MVLSVKKWGNSQGIMIPKDMLSLLNVRVGDMLDVNINNGTLVARKNNKHKTLEERIIESGVPLEASPELEWGESRGSEIW